VKTITRVTGTVTATRIFKTDGQIIHATWQSSKLRWLAAESGKLVRDGERPIADWTLAPGVRFRDPGR
jgi:hypothetical protein